MHGDSEGALEHWLRGLPSARAVFPPDTFNRLKYLFWRFYTPFHPVVRDTALAVGVVRHSGRQDYLLGTIAPDQTIQEFVEHCLQQGYGNHFIAWHDDGELVSLRYVEDFVYQYHVRIFEDGEVRGHYEYTPEHSPIRHVREVGMEDRRHVFYEHFGGRLSRTD